MEETNMSKCLVSGGCGFIGSHLVDKLIELGHEVTVIDDLSSGKIEHLNPRANLIKQDIRQIPTSESYDYIFHLAAIPRVPYSVEFPVLTHDVNVNGTLFVLELARYTGCKKVIFASSSSVYGDAKLPLKEDFSENTPKSPYAMQKRIGELLMRLYDELYGVPTLSLRFFNVYGKRCDPDSEYSLVIGKFLKQKAEGKLFTIYGDGEQTRDFTHVSDIVDGLIAGMETDIHNEVINLCNGENISINKIANLIGGEKQYLAPRKGDVLHTLGDNRKAKRLLGWIPKTPVEYGIKEMMS